MLRQLNIRINPTGIAVIIALQINSKPLKLQVSFFSQVNEY